MKLFRERLDAFDWAMEKSTGEDFAALVAVPPTDLATKFWSRLSEFKLSDPKIKEIFEIFLKDLERKTAAKEQLERLAAEAEKQLGIAKSDAAEPAAPGGGGGAPAAAAAAAAPAPGAAPAGGAAANAAAKPAAPAKDKKK